MKLTVEPIPSPPGADHPPPKHDALPQHEFTMGLIAPKGSGKTTVLCNLLKFYKGYFHTILIFSPTVASDDKWEWVKKQKLLANNTALKKWLENRTGEENTVVEAPKIEVELPKWDGGLIPEDCFHTEYDSDTLQAYMDEQMKMVTLLSQHGKTKHLANRILIIFDDLVGSSLFSNKRNNPFKILNANHRHHSASLLMVSLLLFRV
jgi:Poxvirus A32 protein